MLGVRKLALLLDRLYAVCCHIAYERYMKTYYEEWQNRPHRCDIYLFQIDPMGQVPFWLRRKRPCRIKNGELCNVKMEVIFEGKVVFGKGGFSVIDMVMEAKIILIGTNDPVTNLEKRTIYVSYDDEKIPTPAIELIFSDEEYIHPSVFEQIAIEKEQWVKFCKDFIERLQDKDALFEGYPT